MPGEPSFCDCGAVLGEGHYCRRNCIPEPDPRDRKIAELEADAALINSTNADRAARWEAKLAGLRAKLDSLRPYADAWRAADAACRRLIHNETLDEWNAANNERASVEENCAGAICALFPATSEP